MDKLDIRIIKLAPMHVASFQASGVTAERDAFKKLFAWAQPKGLLNDLAKNSLFGFASHEFIEDKKGTGYKFWIKIPDNIEPEPDINVEDSDGGLYLVMSSLAVGNIGLTTAPNWLKLRRWAQENGYEMGSQQQLVRFYSVPLLDNAAVDLYFPIVINVPGMTGDQYVRLIREIDEDSAFKKLSTVEKIDKLKDNINKATGENEEGKEGMGELRNELLRVREEVRDLKQVVRSLMESELLSKPVSPVPFTCYHDAHEPHTVFITINEEGTRTIKCDTAKSCKLCIYNTSF